MCTSSVLQRAHAEPYPERPGQRERLLLSPACFRKARAGFYTPVSSSPACWSSEVYRNKWERTFYPLFRWSFVFLACVCRKKTKQKGTYLSSVHFSSCWTLLYLLRVVSTLAESCGALAHLGLDLRNVSASWSLEVFSGSIVRTMEAMSYKETS